MTLKDMAFGSSARIVRVGGEGVCASTFWTWALYPAPS